MKIHFFRLKTATKNPSIYSFFGSTLIQKFPLLKLSVNPLWSFQNLETFNNLKSLFFYKIF